MQGPLGSESQRRLLDAMIHVGSELDLASVLRRIVDVATELVGATYGALGVLDESRTLLAEFHTVGLPDDTVSKIGEPPKGHGILGVLIVEPKPLRLPDLAAHPDSFGFPIGHPQMASFLGVPIIIRGESYGNLYLCDKRGGDQLFTDEDEELAIALASAASVAIDNARLHAQVRDLALAAERERIARDLHDTVIQRVFAVGLGLQQALTRTDPGPVYDAIDLAIDELDETVREVRSAIFELKQSQRNRRTLRESVTSIAAEASRVLGFEPAVTIRGPVDTAVGGEQASHVLAVVREALSNVARHASASSATVTLSAETGFLTLTITDDGIGMDRSTDGGNGLNNMESRAVRFGGRLNVAAATTQGRGTILTWAIPLAT